MDAASVHAEVVSGAKRKSKGASRHHHRSQLNRSQDPLAANLLKGSYLLVQKLRATALPTLLGLAVALLITMPSVAFADDEVSTTESSTSTEVSEFHAAVQPEISNAILDASSSLVKQAKVSNLLDTALSLEGSPYSYGGTTPRGFDCSGFTRYCFDKALGMKLPRTAAAQAALGESVSMDELQPGDLLFWGSGSGVYHVGIYVEDGTYIHAAGSGKGVRVQSMEYFHPSFAKRVC